VGILRDSRGKFCYNVGIFLSVSNFGMAEKKEKKGNYDASSISVLEGL